MQTARKPRPGPVQRFLAALRRGDRTRALAERELARWKHRVFIQGVVQAEVGPDGARRLVLVTDDGARLQVERTHVGKYLDDYVGFEVLVRGPVVLDGDRGLCIRPMSFQEVVAEGGGDPRGTLN